MQKNSSEARKLRQTAKNCRRSPKVTRRGGGGMTGSAEGEETVKSFVRSYYSASKDLDDKSAAIITACINRGLKCFHNCSDENFYKSTVKGSVFEAMAGVNVTILAYGQTASGKTYTMKSTTDFAFMDMISFAASSTDRIITFTVKYYKIYSEDVHDLSQPRERIHDRSQLRVQKGADGMVQIKGLNSVTVKNVQDIQNFISACQKNSQVAETKANDHSSRSHAIIEIGINNEPKYHSDGATALQSTLHLVDLAGSENIDNSGDNISRQREGRSINKSLSALSQVVHELSMPSAKRGHVSYRNSNLTRVLEPALCGDSRAVILNCINPTHVEESKRTIDFARHARQVTTNAKVNKVAISLSPTDKETAPRLMEATVVPSPTTTNTTNTELLDQICRLKDELSSKDAELADKDAEIKRLQDALLVQMSWDRSSDTNIGQVDPDTSKQLRHSDSHLSLVSDASRNEDSGGHVSSDYDLHQKALVHKSSVIGELEIKLERSHGETERLRSELGRKDDRVAQLEATVAELKSCNDDLCNEGESLRAENVESVARLAELKSVEEKLVAEIKTLHDKRGEDAEYRKQLAEEIKMLRNNNASLQLSMEQQVDELVRENCTLANKVRVLSNQNDELRREQEKPTTADVDIGVPISDEDSRDMHCDDDDGEAMLGRPDDVGDDFDASVDDGDSFDYFFADDDDDEATVEKPMPASDESLDENYSGCKWSDEENDSVGGQTEESGIGYSSEDDHVGDASALSNMHEENDEDSITDDQSLELREVQDDSIGGIDIVEVATYMIDEDSDDGNVPPPPPLPGQVFEAGNLAITHTGNKPNDELWNERLGELCEYKRENGNCNVPFRKGPLGQWVARQREYYRKREAGKKTSLTDERVAALDAVGFEWVGTGTNKPGKSSDELWNERLVELQEYKKENGHCNVPQRQGPLGTWVSKQRSLYRKREDGGKTPLTDKRVAALDAIGFLWKLR